ncbi:hypothetical protein FOCG_06013 [Fusarium oxysporum f. sp. radicis-lycopersici 26381]|nr:hypothetical protein FOWG_03609 [Fusarium oxysporum f. sp. lycopersici MN25]EWZ96133.1 hypothetical protein FOWG_03609 [Fusarium oxysporum f. sp. lycopersici MN25]EXL55410.1 hypothetical protein FOCG_06013 [Fusarium oxysporum f. sp. radicis-lycopersici 26381]EXL55411.1 hypothetical protein FOCG_06013 [Fusarium oxysporum f. sp. radicis-lycopersici 26381]
MAARVLPAYSLRLVGKDRIRLPFQSTLIQCEWYSRRRLYGQISAIENPSSMYGQIAETCCVVLSRRCCPPSFATCMDKGQHGIVSIWYPVTHIGLRAEMYVVDSLHMV